MSDADKTSSAGRVWVVIKEMPIYIFSAVCIYFICLISIDSLPDGEVEKIHIKYGQHKVLMGNAFYCDSKSSLVAQVERVERGEMVWVTGCHYSNTEKDVANVGFAWLTNWGVREIVFHHNGERGWTTVDALKNPE
jgi:hypothetical protein